MNLPVVLKSLVQLRAGGLQVGVWTRARLVTKLRFKDVK